MHKNSIEKKVQLTIYDGKEVVVFKGPAIYDFIDSKPDEIRVTQVVATDYLLLELQDAGAKLMHCHWHSLGIDPGTAASDIVKKVHALPDIIFNEYKPNKDLAHLKKLIDMRNAQKQYAGDYIRRLKQIGRNQMLLTEDEMKTDDELLDGFEVGKKISKFLSALSEDGEKTVSLETRIKNISENISEILLFESITGVARGSMWASKLVANIGGIARFPSVAALWHYCGEHVNDGKAPKRARGSAIDYNPEVRTINWQGVSSCLMQKSKWKWYSEFVKVKSFELANHATKCVQNEGKPCKTPQGHCHNQAMRKIRKEILKNFWVACNTQKTGEASIALEPTIIMPPLQNQV